MENRGVPMIAPQIYDDGLVAHTNLQILSFEKRF
jgi:hypothetical protein